MWPGFVSTSREPAHSSDLSSKSEPERARIAKISENSVRTVSNSVCICALCQAQHVDVSGAGRACSAPRALGAGVVGRSHSRGGRQTQGAATGPIQFKVH